MIDAHGNHHHHHFRIMTDLDSDPPPFKGTSTEECEVFVARIRRRALTQGKHRDNEWMAVFASSCFLGDALYWYEELEEDVQNDWSRLRPALLRRFGREASTISTTTLGASSISTSAPFSTIPTPAAAPPSVVPHPSVRKGHLKVLRSSGSLHGYLAKPPDRDGLYETTSGALSDALLVSFSVPSSDETFEIQIINASQRPQTSEILAITWSYLPGDRWMGKTTYRARCCSFLTVTSNQDWAIKRKVWKISKAGELSVEYPRPDGGAEILHCSVGREVLFRRFVPAEPERGRIIFEDVV